MSRERGRKKLMMRLPWVRDVLALQATETLFELFESYDLATDALDGFRSAGDKTRIEEYEVLCQEIEQEVMVYCGEQLGRQMRL